MSKVNLVFTANGQDHEHAGTVYEKQQAVKAVVDFEIKRKEAGFYTISGRMSHSIYLMTGLIIGRLRTGCQ